MPTSARFSRTSHSRNSNVLHVCAAPPLGDTTAPMSNHAAHAATRAAFGPVPTAGTSVYAALRVGNRGYSTVAAKANSLLPRSGQAFYRAVTSTPAMHSSTLAAPTTSPSRWSPAAMSASYNMLPHPHQRYAVRLMRRLCSIAEQDNAACSDRCSIIDTPHMPTWCGQRHGAEGITAAPPAPMPCSCPRFANGRAHMVCCSIRNKGHSRRYA